MGLTQIGAAGASDALSNPSLSIEAGGLGAREFGRFQVGAEGWFNYVRSTPPGKEWMSLSVEQLDLRARAGYHLCERCTLAARLGYVISLISDFSPGAALPTQGASGPVGGLQMRADDLWERLEVILSLDALWRRTDTAGDAGMVYSGELHLSCRLWGPLRAIGGYALSYEKSDHDSSVAHLVGLGFELEYEN
jgi:hypothetical protein